MMVATPHFLQVEMWIITIEVMWYNQMEPSEILILHGVHLLIMAMEDNMEDVLATDKNPHMEV